MKTVLLMRHAKASHGALADHDRPLTDGGRRDAATMGRFLRDSLGVPDLVIASSAKRAVETAELAAAAAGYIGAIVHRVDLYGGGPDEYLDVLRALDDGVARVLVVGHNPGIEQAWIMLTGEERHLATGAVGEIRLALAAWANLDPQSRGLSRGPWKPRGSTDDRPRA